MNDVEKKVRSAAEQAGFNPFKVWSVDGIIKIQFTEKSIFIPWILKAEYSQNIGTLANILLEKYQYAQMQDNYIHLQTLAYNLCTEVK